MRIKRTMVLPGLMIAGVAAWSQMTAFSAEGPYGPAGEIKIGGEARWDYLSVDPAGRRLYVSHGTEVVVVNADDNRIVARISPTPGVHGVAVAHELGRGFISVGGESKVAIFDLGTNQVLSTVTTGPNPDAILFEPGRQEVYAFNRRGQSATVFDAKTGNVVATIPLSGNPEFAQADPKAGRVYSNIDNKSEVDVIDTGTHTVVAKWPIAPGESASGMAIDLAHHRLFLGCENKMMLMMDSGNGKVLATIPIGAGVDANAFDPGTGLAFASSSDGTLTVARPDADSLTLVQTLQTPVRSRTMTVDPTTHRVYASAASYQAQEAGGAGQARPQPVPDSFRVMVYEYKPGTSRQ